MNDAMLDLETLGLTPGSAILSIGAVQFSIPECKLGAMFYVNIEPKSCLLAGLTRDEATMAWWGRKSQAAKDALLVDRVPLREALVRFGNYLEDMGIHRERKVWGNGPNFDNAILAHAYKALRLPVPWPYWGDRCFRTIKGMYAAIPMGARQGTHHNSLDDAVYQAEHILNIKRTTMAKRHA